MGGWTFPEEKLSKLKFLHVKDIGDSPLLGNFDRDASFPLEVMTDQLLYGVTFSVENDEHFQLKNHQRWTFPNWKPSTINISDREVNNDELFQWKIINYKDSHQWWTFPI